MRPRLEQRFIFPSAAPRPQAMDIVRVAWEPLIFIRSGNRFMLIILTGSSAPRLTLVNDDSSNSTRKAEITHADWRSQRSERPRDTRWHRALGSKSSRRCRTQSGCGDQRRRALLYAR